LPRVAAGARVLTTGFVPRGGWFGLLTACSLDELSQDAIVGGAVAAAAG
jgi:hypothetical protein